MSDNKVIAIVIIGFFAFAVSISIWGGTNPDVEIEKEKTKQLLLQYRIDSIAALKNPKQ